MANSNGRTIADLIQHLTSGNHYSFPQAVRLVQLISQYHQRVLKGREISLEVLPELSLSFPESDVHSLTYDETSETFTMVATFLGLYGVSSPLPTFYTEDLMDEVSEDISVNKDFLDIIHHLFYRHLIDGLQKYKIDLGAFESKNALAVDRLYSLMGLGETSFRQSVPDARSLLRYTGLFSHCPRSAAGLKALLSDYFQTAVKIVSGYASMVGITEDQRLSLGGHSAYLGVETILGEQMPDRAGNILIQIGPVDKWTFDAFAQGKANHKALVFLVHFYLLNPLHCYIEVKLNYDEIKPCELGHKKWSMLGESAWLGEDKNMLHSLQYHF